MRINIPLWRLEMPVSCILVVYCQGSLPSDDLQWSYLPGFYIDLLCNEAPQRLHAVYMQGQMDAMAQVSDAEG